ncbi:glycan-binding surface protein [Bacteroides sp. GM023]|uniref:glycan-binding surface protein n=1 Tax=Bacteroides sp. GM023 TaxID=2723058 RepID=UPI00168B5D2F|nr:glycan-binding surface protein [Bacteroides sp. GM023]MBD3590943.1 hypothetical protein [Bacteroides sp. GM023]
MRYLRYIQSVMYIFMMTVILTGVFSCSDDEKDVEEILPPTITKVCVWNEESQEWTIPEAGQMVRIGSPLRIEGTNMDKTIAVYINGGQVAGFQAGMDEIELVIPEIPVDEEDVKEVNLNLVRVVNKAGAATCTAEDFQFFGKLISVSGLSLTENGGRTWTTVEEAPIGSRIRIEGDGLKTIKELQMNGMYIDLAKATINDDALIVDIPEDMPFGKAVSDPASLNKLVITTAYDGPKIFDCVVAGRQIEITEITDGNGNKIEEAGRNTVVKIVGKYFATFQGLRFNGQKIEPTSVESSCITFTVPTDTENFKVGEGTLEIVSAYDEVGISRVFNLLGFVPNVTAVSYTMPKPGNVIRLTGVNLLQEAKVFFPSSSGEKEGHVQEAANDGTSIDVLVPEGVGDKAGYLRIVSEGNEATVKGIVMFYNQGVFLREFTDDELKLGSVSGAMTQNKSALYTPTSRPAMDIQPVNPDYFICFKNTSVPVSTSKHGAYLRFSTKAQIEKVLESSNAQEITANTLVKDIVLQVDVYMPNSWSSGTLAWRVDKDRSIDGPRVLNMAPWRKEKEFAFGKEWHTFTYKFTDFALTDSEKETLTLGVWLSKYAAKSDGAAYVSLFTFVNGNLMYKDKEQPDPQWDCVDITNFEMNLANMRLVPLSLNAE